MKIRSLIHDNLFDAAQYESIKAMACCGWNLNASELFSLRSRIVLSNIIARLELQTKGFMDE